MISTHLKRNTFTLMSQEKSSAVNFVTWKIEGGTRDFRVLKRFIYKRKDYEMNDILGKSRHPGDDESNVRIKFTSGSQ
jgi:hypothetical protein